MDNNKILRLNSSQVSYNTSKVESILFNVYCQLQDIEEVGDVASIMEDVNRQYFKVFGNYLGEGNE